MNANIETLEKLADVLAQAWAAYGKPKGKEPMTWLENEKVVEFISGLGKADLWLIAVNYASHVSAAFYNIWSKTACSELLAGRIPISGVRGPVSNCTR